MPAKRPALPGTLASYAESGLQVFVVCDHCGRFTKPQFQLIAQRAGWRAMAADLGKRMRCSVCHQRGAHFTTQRPRGRSDVFRSRR